MAKPELCECRQDIRILGIVKNDEGGYERIMACTECIHSIRAYYRELAEPWPDTETDPWLPRFQYSNADW